MEFLIISEICIPFILIIRGVQFYVQKKSYNFLDSDHKLYKQMMRSLIPAYIEAIKIFMAIRDDKREEITNNDTCYLEKTWQDFSLKNVDDIKELHLIVERLIDKKDGRPESIFRSNEDWESIFEDSNNKFYESCSEIYKIKSNKPLIDSINCNCWIMFIISIAAFIITLGLIELSLNITLLSIQLEIIPFFIGIFSLVILIFLLIKLILILKKIQRVFNHARQYSIQ